MIAWQFRFVGGLLQSNIFKKMQFWIKKKLILKILFSKWLKPTESHESNAWSAVHKPDTFSTEPW